MTNFNLKVGRLEFKIGGLVGKGGDQQEAPTGDVGENSPPSIVRTGLGEGFAEFLSRSRRGRRRGRRKLGGGVVIEGKFNSRDRVFSASGGDDTGSDVITGDLEAFFDLTIFVDHDSFQLKKGRK